VEQTRKSNVEVGIKVAPDGCILLVWCLLMAGWLRTTKTSCYRMTSVVETEYLGENRNGETLPLRFAEQCAPQTGEAPSRAHEGASQDVDSTLHPILRFFRAGLLQRNPEMNQSRHISEFLYKPF